MDAPGDYHTKWSKSDRGIQISYDIAYMWNQKKMIQMSLFTKCHRGKSHIFHLLYGQSKIQLVYVLAVIKEIILQKLDHK